MSRLEELRLELTVASDVYYNTGTRTMGDKDYDKKMKEFISLGGELLVGADPRGKGITNVSHAYGELVGTLDKAQCLEDVEKWINEKVNLLGYVPSFLITLKFDGNSIVIEYRDGKIYQVLTRGKNGKGLDLTHVFSHTIKMKENVGIKYEVVMTYDNFEKIQKDFNEEYVNPRSIVGGKLGDDNAKIYEPYFTLVPLWIKKEGQVTERTEQLELMEKEFGEDSEVFEHIYLYDKEDKWSVSEIMEKITEIYAEIGSSRDELNYMIDGLVIEIMEQDARNKLGTTSKYPNWAIALKFPYLEEPTKVIGFDYTLGDSGRVTPRVWFEPVKFNGTTHRKQSLQNFKRFKQLGLGIGSDILVQYRNDVLSYIEPMETENNKSIVPEVFTTECPVCHQHTVKINANETFAECTNPDCGGQLVGSVQNYLIKMDIKGTKKNTLDKLKENGMLTGIKDLYTMDYSGMYDIEGLGEKTASKMKEAISSKEAFDWEVLGSLGIKNCGRTKAKDICALYSLKEIMELSNLKDLASPNLETILIENVPGIAEITASYIIDGLDDNKELIEFLLETTNVKGYREEIAANVSNEEPLIIVFTGYRDKEAQGKLELRGHKISSSVSSKTNLVVAKDKDSTSGKVGKAKDLGIEVIEPDEFKKRFNL